MNKIFQTSCAVLLLSAAGCGDGTPIARAAIPAARPPATPQPSPQTLSCTTVTFEQTAGVDALPGGVWQGSLVDCANNVQHDYVTAMVSEDGQFRIIDENEHLLAGALQTTGDRFLGTGIDFAPPGIEYFSGPTTNLFVEGLVAERQTLRGRWGTEWGPYGYFTFDYLQQTYERPTSLADLAGVWSSHAHHSGVQYEGSWTIEADGRFDGQDNRGCLHSGQFSLIDDRYSIVSVQLTVTACAFADSYSGLAQLEDLVDWWEKSIMVSVDNGTRALRIGLAVERP